MILFANTLEHVLDLDGAVKNLSDICEDNGMLYIEVPDAESYANFEQVPYYYFDIEHINHFNEDALMNLLGRYEFSQKFAFRHEIDVSSKKYPMLGVVFEKKGKELGTVVKSLRLRESITRYISGASFDRINTLLAPYIDKGPVIVWGAGQFTARLLPSTSLSKCEIAYFVDKDPGKVGKNINGAPIKSPKDIKEKFPIVICSALFVDEIVREIAAMGLDNVVIPLI